MLQIQLNGSYSKMNVKIFSAAGQVVKQKILTAVNSTISIPVQNLAAGQYWLQLQNGNDRQLSQFVK